MSWLVSHAAELLESADKRAGKEIQSVKERVGITPAGPEAVESGSTDVVVLSRAAAALRFRRA